MMNTGQPKLRRSSKIIKETKGELRETERPSTASTMSTLLTYNKTSYQKMMEFSGSENERQALRRNRVAEMQLRVCLGEIFLQRRTLCQLLEVERSRFLQRAQQKPMKLRSEAMLVQFKFWKSKKSPCSPVSVSALLSHQEHTQIKKNNNKR